MYCVRTVSVLCPYSVRTLSVLCPGPLTNLGTFPSWELKSVFVFCARRRGILPPRPTNRNLPARVARPAQRPRVPLPPLPWVAPDKRRDLRRQDAARDRSCLPTHTHSGRRSPPPTTPPGPALSRRSGTLEIPRGSPVGFVARPGRPVFLNTFPLSTLRQPSAAAADVSVRCFQRCSFPLAALAD